jgi:hypothetical protein
MTKEDTNEYKRTAILKMFKKPRGVAGCIRISKGNSPHKILSVTNISRECMASIVKWMLGAVACHQKCMCCNQAELSREHAGQCSGIIQDLNREFPDLMNSCPVDELPLNYILGNIDFEKPHQLETIARAVDQIKMRCLKWRLNEGGKLVGPNHPSLLFPAPNP